MRPWAVKGSSEVPDEVRHISWGFLLKGRALALTKNVREHLIILKVVGLGEFSEVRDCSFISLGRIPGLASEKSGCKAILGNIRNCWDSPLTPLTVLDAYGIRRIKRTRENSLLSTRSGRAMSLLSVSLNPEIYIEGSAARLMPSDDLTIASGVVRTLVDTV